MDLKEIILENKWIGWLHLKDVKPGETCKYCGAPATTEICPFCHKPTGIKPLQADLDYPMVTCKAAHLNKKFLKESAIAAALYLGILLPIIVMSYIDAGMKTFLTVLFACSIFIIFALAEYIIPSILMISRNNKVKRYGKKIKAKVPHLLINLYY